MPESQAVNLLLVEDDEVDAEAFQRAFRKKRIANPLRIARDGVEALHALRGTNGQPRLPRPYLILLDLNMPRMNGIEFLGELRRDADLHDGLVIVLTTSDDDRDKVAAYQQHVAGYIVKSRAGDDFTDLMEFLDCFWRYVEFPPRKVR